MILTPLQKLPKNGGDWGKLIVAKGLKTYPKSNKSHNLVTLNRLFIDPVRQSCLQCLVMLPTAAKSQLIMPKNA